MEVLTDTRFWGEVGLAAAGRLALLAAVIWVARLVLVRQSTPATRTTHPVRTGTPAPAATGPAGTAPSPRFVDLTTRATPVAGARGPAPDLGPGSGLRERLNRYLQEPSARGARV